MGLFITFEGGEGSGKTSQARALRRKLAKLGILTVLTQEPGGTWLGNMVRQILKRKDIPQATELLLFCASRAQLVSKVIQPRLFQDSVVICARYAESTLAYQGYGRGLDLEMVRSALSIATGGLRPDLIILLDIDPAIGLARKQAGSSLLHRFRGIGDKFSKLSIDFHCRVRQGYLELAATEPERWFIVDASLPKKEVERLIWERVDALVAEVSISIRYGSELEA